MPPSKRHEYLMLPSRDALRRQGLRAVSGIGATIVTSILGQIAVNFADKHGLLGNAGSWLDNLVSAFRFLTSWPVLCGFFAIAGFTLGAWIDAFLAKRERPQAALVPVPAAPLKPDWLLMDAVRDAAPEWGEPSFDEWEILVEESRWQMFSLAVADLVAMNHLHVWGRVSHRPLQRIGTSEWADCRLKLGYGSASLHGSYEWAYSDLHLSHVEAEPIIQAWLKAGGHLPR